MLSFQVSWADDPKSQVTIEARSPYKAYRAFLKREGHEPEVVVEVRRGRQIDTFINHFEKPKSFLERVRRSDPDPKSREGIYGKSGNDDLGCLLMFLVGPLPFRLVGICVLGFFLLHFKSNALTPSVRAIREWAKRIIREGKSDNGLGNTPTEKLKRRVTLLRANGKGPGLGGAKTEPRRRLKSTVMENSMVFVRIGTETVKSHWRKFIFREASARL